MRLTSRAGKIPDKDLKDRMILLEVEYFRVERLHPAESWTRTSLQDEGEAVQGLAYLFAAAGTDRLTGEGFEPVELPARGIVAQWPWPPIFWSRAWAGWICSASRPAGRSLSR